MLGLHATVDTYQCLVHKHFLFRVDIYSLWEVLVYICVCVVCIYVYIYLCIYKYI